jgi:O-antigen ligase
MIFLLIIYCVRTWPEVVRLGWGILAGVLLLQLQGLFLNTQDRLQVTGMYDPNDIAFVMVCALPLAAFLFVMGKGVQRYVAGAATALAILMIIMTRSRGGFVSLVIVGSILLFRLPSRQRLKGVALAVGAILIFGLSAGASYWDRMGTIFGDAPQHPNDYDSGGLTEARWNIWMTGLRIMVENPLVGVGAGAFEVAEGMTHGGIGKWDAAHNSFIHVGAELGFVGLALFLFLLYRGVKNCRFVASLARRDRRFISHLALAQGLEVSIYAYIVMGSTLSQGYAYLLYVFLGMSVALARFVEPQLRQDKDAQDVRLNQSRTGLSPARLAGSTRDAQIARTQRPT